MQGRKRSTGASKATSVPWRESDKISFLSSCERLKSAARLRVRWICLVRRLLRLRFYINMFWGSLEILEQRWTEPTLHFEVLGVVPVADRTDTLESNLAVEALSLS